MKKGTVIQIKVPCRKSLCNDYDLLYLDKEIKKELLIVSTKLAQKKF